jgi:hypothetical protein
VKYLIQLSRGDVALARPEPVLDPV